MNKVFWMFRMILCYFLYQNIELFGYSIELIVTIVVIYFMPNMCFKMINFTRVKIDGEKSNN